MDKTQEETIEEQDSPVLQVQLADIDSSMAEVGTWLDSSVTVATTTPLQGITTPTDPLLSILNEKGITSTDALNAIIQMAEIGNTHLLKLRDQTKKLAIITLGQVGAQMAAAIDEGGYNLVSALHSQYWAMAKSNGVVKNPYERVTSPESVTPQLGSVAERAAEIKQTMRANTQYDL